MPALSDEERRILRALAEKQCVIHGDPPPDAAALEDQGLIAAHSVNLSEVLLQITNAGRVVLEALDEADEGIKPDELNAENDG